MNAAFAENVWRVTRKCGPIWCCTGTKRSFSVLSQRVKRLSLISLPSWITSITLTRCPIQSGSIATSAGRILKVRFPLLHGVGLNFWSTLGFITVIPTGSIESVLKAFKRSWWADIGLIFVITKSGEACGIFWEHGWQRIPLGGSLMNHKPHLPVISDWQPRHGRHLTDVKGAFLLI